MTATSEIAKGPYKFGNPCLYNHYLEQSQPISPIFTPKLNEEVLEFIRVNTTTQQETNRRAIFIQYMLNI
jgi:hypothetical protein